MAVKTYKVGVNVLSGLTVSRENVVFKSAANTRRGVFNAMAKAIARQLGTDVIEVRNYIYRDGVSRDYALCEWRNGGHISAADDNYITSKVRDELFNMMY